MNLNEGFGKRKSRRGKTFRNIRQNAVPQINITSMRHPSVGSNAPSTSTAPQTASSSTFHINWNRPSTFGSAQRSGFSSKTRTSSELESRVVLAVTEGRGGAECEVGIATMNTMSPHLILCQISDTQSYVNTLTKINILNPAEILVPVTFMKNFTSNRLVDKIKQKFENVKITPVSRSTFHKTKGLERIEEICVPSLNSVLLLVQHKYYASSAAAALLTYTENVLNCYFAKHSIKVEYQQSEGFAIIDLLTADQLELVQSTSSASNGSNHSSLLGILNHCYTKVGQRTLRSSILQPSCCLADIQANLNCVTDLINNPDLISEIQNVLSKISNIDQLLMLSTILPEKSENCSDRQLNYILLLNTLLCCITPLKDLLSNFDQPFFHDLKRILSSESFVFIKNKIQEMIHSDAHLAKGHNGIIQRCFAIKTGVNGLLDLMRTSYSKLLDEMREYVKSLGEKYNLQLVLGNNNKKGFHIVLNLTPQQRRFFKKSDLPDEFFEVCRLTGSFTVKTQELVCLSNRSDDVMLEVLKISNMMIYDLLVEIRTHVPLFYDLCEKIAKLDMLQSLAHASSWNNYVRPKFNCFTELEHSRHPLLEFLCSSIPVANSAYASDDYNVHIITGPNGSGKSIFIRQIMLLQIMAQIGCYVPAASATFRIADRMFAKIYLEDNMDCGASAFVLEMKEINYYLTSATKSSLIIIDELCRSTSIEEGTALAMALCEQFIKKSCFLFFTTHYTAITKLYDMYFNVNCWQLETVEKENKSLEFKYNVIPGVVNLKRYGIALARLTWPDIISDYVERLLDENSHNYGVVAEKVDPMLRLKYDLEAKLRHLKRIGKLDRASLNAHLNQYVSAFECMGMRLQLNLQIETNACGQSDSEGINATNDMRNDLNDRYINDVSVASASQSTTGSYARVNNFLIESSKYINWNPEIIFPSQDNECSSNFDVRNDFGVCDDSQMQLSINNENCLSQPTASGLFVSSKTNLDGESSKTLDQFLEHQTHTVSNVMQKHSSSNVLSKTGTTDTIKWTETNSSNNNIVTRLFSEHQVCTGHHVQQKHSSSNNLSITDTIKWKDTNNSSSEICSIIEDIQNNTEYTDEWDDLTSDKVNVTKTTSENNDFRMPSNISKPTNESHNLRDKRNPFEDDLSQASSISITYSPLCNFGLTTKDSSSFEKSTSINENAPTLNDPKSDTNHVDVNAAIKHTDQSNATKKIIEENVYSEIPKKQTANSESSLLTLDHCSNSKSNELQICNKNNCEDKSETTITKDMNPLEKSGTNSKSPKSSTNSKRRKKFVSPLTNVINLNATSVTKKTVCKSKTLIPNKFVPPKALTKRQIQQDYYEQDKLMFQDTDSSKNQQYLEQILNRPSVKQLQEMTHLALIRRTEDGVIIIPPLSPKKKRTTKASVTPRAFENSNIDVSLFSDKNASHFDEFMQTKKGVPAQFIKSNSFNDADVHLTTVQKHSEKIFFRSQDHTQHLLNNKDRPVGVLAKSQYSSDDNGRKLESNLSENYFTPNKGD